MTDTGQPGPDPAQRGTRPVWASTGAEAAASRLAPPASAAPVGGAPVAQPAVSAPAVDEAGAPAPYLGYRAAPASSTQSPLAERTPLTQRTPPAAAQAPAPEWTPPAPPAPFAPAAPPAPATQAAAAQPAAAAPAAPAAPPTLIDSPVAQPAAPTAPAQPAPPAEPTVLVAPDPIRYASRPAGRTVQNSFGAAGPSPLASTTGEEGSASGGDEPPSESKPRPRWLLPAAIGVAVVVVIGVVAGIIASRSSGSDDAPPPVASTILLPSPTPSVDPVARTATTAFAAALPTSVLQYALATSEPYPDWQAAGAIEAYTETYTDGESGTVSVQVGQWESAEEAGAFAATLVAALPQATADTATDAPTASASASAAADAPDLPQSGDVTAGGQKAGTYTIVDAGDGTGIAVWTNGTVVFRVVAPVDEIVDVYSAFPL